MLTGGADIRRLVGLAIPTKEEVEAGVDRIPHRMPPRAWYRGEPRYFLTVTGGAIRLSKRFTPGGDTGHLFSVPSAQTKLRHGVGAEPPAWLNEPMYRAQLPEAPARHDRRALVKDRRGMVLGWSRRSRTRGEFVLQSLDWSPLFDGDQQPGMLTLTLPGDLWEFTVPSPRAYKNIVNRLQRLWARAWGSAPVGAWKMEFQERGAVHLHLLTVPPSGLSGGRAHANGSSRLVWSRGDLVSLNTGGLEFLSWISLTWAKLVGTHKFEELHPQPLVMRESYERRRKVAFLNHVRIGADFSRSDMVRYMDPRSISMYFIQHGHFTAKEYQNQMPAHWANAVRAGAPSGQYWGYWGLESTGATVELDPVRRESADNAYSSEPSHLIEDRQPWATDASVLRAYARDQVSTTDDKTKIERHMKRLAKSKAARTAGRGGQIVQKVNKRGQLVSDMRIRTLRRDVVNQQTGEITTSKRYQVGYYGGGSGFLTVRDGRVAAADIARLIGGDVAPCQGDYVLVS